MKTVIVTAGMIMEKERVLVAQRMEGALRGLLWEFPGGKVNDGEDPRKALQREIKEELDIEVEVGRIFDVIFYSYPEHPILLLAYECRIKKGDPQPIGCHALQWVSMKELNGLAMPPADEPLRIHLASSMRDSSKPK